MQKRKVSRLDKNESANAALVESGELERSVARSLHLVEASEKEMLDKINFPEVQIAPPKVRRAPLPNGVNAPICKVPSAGSRDSLRELKKSKKKIKNVASFVKKVKKAKTAKKR